MKYKVTFTFDADGRMTEDQAEEFILFELGANGEMSMENPMSDQDLEAHPNSIWIEKD